MQIQQNSLFQPSVVLPRSDFHIVPMQEYWAVKGEANSTYSGIFSTQLEATSYAMGLARMAASSVVLHGKDGRFREVWSYDKYANDVPRIMAGGENVY